MLGKVYNKISYTKKGDKYEPVFTEEFIINLDQIKKIVTKGSPVDDSFFTEIEYVGGSTDKIFRCSDKADLTFEQHASYVNSWFFPKIQNEKI